MTSNKWVIIGEPGKHEAEVKPTGSPDANLFRKLPFTGFSTDRGMVRWFVYYTDRENALAALDTQSDS